MKSIIRKILSLPELKTEPPVLIDIGASEKIHPKWKLIAGYSVCVAFEADERDFGFIEKEQSSFKKLYVYNSVVTNQRVNNTLFHLTKSPYCSSLLKPDNIKLQPYLHSDLFDVKETVRLKAVHLQEALNNLGMRKVDWFKSDSQGTDLRLFSCLDENIRKKVLVAEFEPGIIDTYEGEDKLYSILGFFNDKSTAGGFWLSDITIKGVPRIPSEVFNSEFRGNTFRKFLRVAVKAAPGWGEMTFINSFEEDDFSLRDYLLGWLFSSLERHHSFAFVLAKKGFEKFHSEIFNELKNYSKSQMRREVYRLKFLPSVIQLIKKKLSV